jgi:hypothetical protein
VQVLHANLDFPLAGHRFRSRRLGLYPAHPPRVQVPEVVMTAPVFTVTRVGKRKDAITAQRYRLTVDKLPGRSWTHGFREMSDELFVVALVDRVTARNTILDAHTNGTAEVAGTC